MGWLLGRLALKIVILLGFILALLTYVEIAFAATTAYQSGDTVTLSPTEVVNQDFFAAGQRVEIAGTVNGDVYAAGKEVLVSGNINGDLLVGGGTVTITGKVAQDVRVAGGQLTLSGQVGRYVTLTGGSLNITSDAKLPGNVVVAGGNFVQNAPINGNLTLAVGNALLANNIKGSVIAGVGQLRLSSNAKIGGDLNYWSSKQVSVAPDAKVNGQIVYHPSGVDKPKTEQVAKAGLGFLIFFKIVNALSTFILGLLLLWLFPFFSRSVVNRVFSSPLLSLALGLVLLIGTPILLVILFITVVGIPLSFVGFLVYLLILYVSRIFGIYALGSWILTRFDRKDSTYLALVLGLFIYYGLGIIPVIGDILALIIFITGLGGIFLTEKGMYQDLRKKSLI